MRRWLLFISIGSLFMAILAVTGLEFLARHNVDPIVERHIQVQSGHLESYLEDQMFLADEELLRSSRQGTNDAGPFLNPRVSWTPALRGGLETPSPLISRELREQIVRFRHDWPRRFESIHRLTIDVSLFADLEKFDYWDIELNSPISYLIEKNIFLSPLEIPTPDMLDLVTLAKVRLMGVTTSKTPQTDIPLALRQIRHTAKLLLSTENIHLQLSGLTLLDTERRGFRFFVEKGKIKEDAWTPVSRNVTRRAARVIWATRGYLHLWTPPELFEKVFLREGAPPIGLCAALNEAIPVEFSFRRMLESRMPFERDYRPNFARLIQVYEKGRALCRVRYLEHLFAKNNFDTDFPIMAPLIMLPYTRRLFGLKLSTIGFMGFDGYHEPPPTAAIRSAPGDGSRRRVGRPEGPVTPRLIQ